MGNRVRLKWRYSYEYKQHKILSDTPSYNLLPPQNSGTQEFSNSESFGTLKLRLLFNVTQTYATTDAIIFFFLKDRCYNFLCGLKIMKKLKHKNFQ